MAARRSRKKSTSPRSKAPAKRSRRGPSASPRKRARGKPAAAAPTPAEPVLQCLAPDGTWSGEQPCALDPALLEELLRGMLRIRVLDERMLLLQRQGRIGFFGQTTGQEAAVVGSAAALEPRDWIVPALREKRVNGGLLLEGAIRIIGRPPPIGAHQDQILVLLVGVNEALQYLGGFEVLFRKDRLRHPGY